MGFPGGSLVKNMPAKQETQVQSLGKEDPWGRKWQPIPVFLPGKSHGQKKPGRLQCMESQKYQI